MKFVKNRVCFLTLRQEKLLKLFGQKQGQAFGVPVAHPHLKVWGVPQDGITCKPKIDETCFEYSSLSEEFLILLH